MFSYLRGTFLKINPQYNNYFTVFVFNNKTYDGAVGQIEKNGVKNLVLFIDRNDKTMSHEALHGLGLHHTHRDETPIKEPGRKYIYPNGNKQPSKATDNIMSYNGALRKTTWYWQWKLLWKGL